MQLNLKGELREWTAPVVMGIVNVTPDSFHAGSRVKPEDAVSRAKQMVEYGAGIIDLGGYSTRPGAREVDASEELRRLLPAVSAIKDEMPHIPLSVDTFRSDVAMKCVEAGADIINDISGGDMDAAMFETVAALDVPYVLMHTRGTPATMQTLTDYQDVVAEVLEDLARKTDKLRQLGVKDVIIDPGFGFAKDTDQNYRLLDSLDYFTDLGPVLAGLSRKTMIWKELGITPAEALNGTTALNMAALMKGASILRVHDVKEAVETVKLYGALKRNTPVRNVIYTADSPKI